MRLYRHQFSVTEGRPHKAFAEHSRIVEAIEAKDGEMAELLMRRHISAARQNILMHVCSPHPNPLPQEREFSP